MNEKSLWQFYITFWSVFIVTFIIIYSCNLRFLKTVTLSSISSATLSVINIYFQDKRERCKNQTIECNNIINGLKNIQIDYASDMHYYDIINKAIKIIKERGIK